MTDTKPIHRIRHHRNGSYRCELDRVVFQNKFSQLCCGVSRPALSMIGLHI